jgi:tRNA/rRNA methyltransferase
MSSSQNSAQSRRIRPRGEPGKSPVSGLAVAIVEPEFGINLGYLARTTANFGLNKLIVISKKNLNKNQLDQASQYSAHGRELVDNLEYIPSLRDLKKKFRIVVGTTAIEAKRKSNITRRTFSPEECAQKVSINCVGQKKSICLVFGRDTTGLTNEELRECDYNITIRTRSSYNTLNLSHAAAIILYVFENTWQNSKKNSEASKLVNEMGPASSSRKERDRAVSLFLRLAEDSEFKGFKLNLLREALERVITRGDPSLREIYLLMGLASKAGGKIRRLSSQVP